MLFGLFFGAGNLIFPANMGQLAGSNVWYALGGFLVTGVGIPLLSVAALGISRSSGLIELSSKIGKKYGLFFTCILYLTIGPFFAIPRCATVPFTVGIVPIIGQENNFFWGVIFSFVFFAIVLWFSLRPNGILTWVGKFLNPVFLVCLGVLAITALLMPMGEISMAQPDASYASGAFFNGFIEGYNTMDALAGLAFGVVIVRVIKSFGIEKGEDIAVNTIKSGFLSCLLMAVIYMAVAVIGAQSRGILPIAQNGGEALLEISKHYFGAIGIVILALTVTLACLKTAIGLITSCAETFETMFPNTFKYRTWAVIFCTISFLIANLGLNAIIEYAVPVLMFLYPLAITLIILALIGRVFNNDTIVYKIVTVFTLLAAIFDFLNALPENLKSSLNLEAPINLARNVLPFYDLGLGWIMPAVIGFLVGFLAYAIKKVGTPQKN